MRLQAPREDDQAPGQPGVPAATAPPVPPATAVPPVKAVPPATAVPPVKAVPPATAVPPAWRAVARWAVRGGWPLTAYCASRLVLLLVAVATGVITHRSLAGELFLFDGGWYLRLARYGYPHQALHVQSTLGFLPLYPMLMVAVRRLLVVPLPLAGVAISLVGGLIAAIAVHRVTVAWWGERTARRAVTTFCLFPGSVVFSLVYSEGLTVPLAVGCLLALRSRRWALAGLLAGLAGVVEPIALVLGPVCLGVALRQLWVTGWRDRAARASLLAPLLALTGPGVFAVFLWAWTGTPFASYLAQRYGWHQGGVISLLQTRIAARVAEHAASAVGYLSNPSLWNGVLGLVFLACSLRLLWRHRAELSTGALAWTGGIGAVTLWSVMTLPNARMLLVAFPAVVIWARCLPPRRFRLFLGVELAVFLMASFLTYAGLMLP